MKNIIFALITFTTISSAIAQPFVDIINLRTQKFGFGDKTTTENTMDIFAPLQLKKGNLILIGANYNHVLFQDHNEGSELKLTSASLRLGGIKKWNDDWSTMALIIPKITSDMKDISMEDYQLGGVAMMIKTVNDNFKYKFGLYYNKEHFGNFFMPVFGIDWKVSDKVHVFGILPSGMNIEYKLSDKFYTGISYKSITTSYRLSEKSESSYIKEGHNFWGHNQLKGFINYYPIKGLVLYAEAGHTAFRQFNEYEKGTKNKVSSLKGYKDNLLVNIGASFRIRLDNH